MSMEIQIDQNFVMVNVNTAASNSADNGDNDAMVQIPGSVHCSSGNQPFPIVTSLPQTHQYNAVQGQHLNKPPVPGDLQCFASNSDLLDQFSVPSQNDALLPSTSMQEVEMQLPSKLREISVASNDVDAYYVDIYNYLKYQYLSDNETETYIKSFKKRARNYCIVKDVLHYGHKLPKRVVTSKIEQIHLLEEAHIQNETGVHLGVRKMYASVSQLHFWRGLYVDVANMVRKCSKCSDAAEAREDNQNVDVQSGIAPAPVIEQSQVKAHQPDTPANDFVKESTDNLNKVTNKVWQKVEVKMCGPYPKTGNKKEVILLIVDPISHWIVAQPVTDTDIPTKIGNFIFQTFCSFGFAKYFITCSVLPVLEKARAQFEERVESLKPMLGTLGLTNALPVLYQELSSTCDWAVHLLDTFTAKFPDTWDTMLDRFLFEYHTSTDDQGRSPFSRMFGRSPVISQSEDKENLNVMPEDNPSDAYSKRRRLQSSILQCRHCEEVFTSKISFRIHQRKHTEEARARGTLEGENPVRLVMDREKRLRRSKMWTSKYRRHNCPVEVLPNSDSCLNTSNEDLMKSDNELMAPSNGELDLGESFLSTQQIVDCHSQSLIILKNVVSGSVACEDVGNPVEEEAAEKNKTRDMNILLYAEASASNDHHTSNTDRKAVLRCDACGKRFHNNTKLLVHIEKHCTSDMLKCVDCSYTTRSTKLLQYHQNIHKEIFKCDVCCKSFTRKIYLKYHISDVHTNPRNSHVCKECGSKFASASGLKNHIQSNHEQSKNYSCGLCNYIGRSSNCVTVHISRKHKKKFKCGCCNYGSNTQGGLDRHVKIVHSEKERQFPCKQCSYRGEKRRQLLEHERTVHSQDKDKHQCPICNKSFKTLIIMKHHLISHTRQHLYSCKRCTYTTRHRQTLHYHIKHSHPGESVKDLSSGPSEADFEAIISAAMIKDPLPVAHQVTEAIVASHVELLLNNESSNEPAILDHDSVIYSKSFNSSLNLSNAQDAQIFMTDEYFSSRALQRVMTHHILEESTSTGLEDVNGTNLDSETEQAVTIIDGSGLTKDEVNTIVSLAGDLSLGRHELHQLVTISDADVQRAVLPTGEYTLGDGEIQQIVTYVDNLDSLKTNLNHQTVTFINNPQLSCDVGMGTHIDVLDNNEGNLVIVPLRDADVSIYQAENCLTNSEPQQLVLEHDCDLLASVSQQNIQSDCCGKPNWNQITVYHLDQ